MFWQYKKIQAPNAAGKTVAARDIKYLTTYLYIGIVLCDTCYIIKVIRKEQYAAENSDFKGTY